MQNAFVEFVNGRLCCECLNEHLFGNLAEARPIVEAWKIAYNTRHPHPSLNGLHVNCNMRSSFHAVEILQSRRSNMKTWVRDDCYSRDIGTKISFLRRNNGMKGGS